MPEFHPLCSDRSVISSKRPRIRGYATPGSRITVRLAGVSLQTTADAAGQWLAEFPKLPAGGPHLLVARDADGEVSAQDVYLGEVWLGSGQSNMEWSLAMTKDSEDDIAAASEPMLRVFMVEKANTADGPVSELRGRWEVCTPRNAALFSAVGYHFGRRMVAETGLPFGIIVSAWGGSAIASWLPEHVLQTRPEYRTFLSRLHQARQLVVSENEYQPYEDPGVAEHAAAWSLPSLDDEGWPLLQVPGQWQNEGWDFNGAVWFRTCVEIPSEWLGEELELSLGVVDDCDHTFVNGVLIGQTGTETPNWWSTPRFYQIPAALVTGERISVSIRVFDVWGGGGIMGNPRLRPVHRPDATPIQFSGRWRAKAELELPLRFPGGPPVAPTSLWNAMIHPLLGTGIDGCLWYQGESDVERAGIYQQLLTDLIHAWRKDFEAPRLPFGIVQLANYMERQIEPVESPWAELREAQRLVALNVPGCGLAVAIDAGEADDIHPRYKKTVGERLALWALHDVYGRTEIAHSGPLPVEIRRDGHGLRVRFVHANGLRWRGEIASGFQVRGADMNWNRAETSAIAGDTVLVASSAVPSPVAVRYAWQDNPEADLENAAGLPATPFQMGCC